MNASPSSPTKPLESLTGHEAVAREAKAEHLHAGGSPLLTRARSSSEMPSRGRRLVSPSGNDGWLRTGASMRSSTIIPSAKPPVKHMPTAPTPGPPHRLVRVGGRRRNQPLIGVVLFSDERSELGARHTRARSTQARRYGLAPTGCPRQMRHDRGAPDIDDSTGEAATAGVMPGISAMTITAGPSPLRNTLSGASVVRELAVVKSSSASTHGGTASGTTTRDRLLPLDGAGRL